MLPPLGLKTPLDWVGGGAGVINCGGVGAIITILASGIKNRVGGGLRIRIRCCVRVDLRRRIQRLPAGVAGGSIIGIGCAARFAFFHCVPSF